MAVRRDILKAISIMALSSTSPALAHDALNSHCKKVRTPEEIADDMNESLTDRFGGKWSVYIDDLGKFALFKKI